MSAFCPTVVLDGSVFRDDKIDHRSSSQASIFPVTVNFGPAIALLVVCRRRRPSECHANELQTCGLEVNFAYKIGCHGNVP